MCIAHQIACNCEQVRLPTLGSHDTWRVMRNRFKLAHANQTERTVERILAPEPIVKPPVRRVSKYTKWEPIVIPPVRRVSKHIKWEPIVKPPVGRVSKHIKWGPVETIPMHKQQNCIGWITSRTVRVDGDVKKAKPVLKPRSVSTTLFLPNSIKTRGIYLPHARNAVAVI